MSLAVPLNTTSPGSSSSLGFWAACMLAPLPMMVPYLTGLWQLEHYQYFPLVFISVAALAHARWDRSVQAPLRWFHWALIAIGWLCAATAIMFFSPWLGAVGFVAIGAAWLAALHEPSGRSLMILVLPLLTLVRLPLAFDELLIIRLQSWTTRLTSGLLDLALVPHMATGNVIRLANRELFVAEACSGIQSVFTLLFLANLLAAYMRRPMWMAPLFWGAAVMLAVFGNSLRIAMVATAEVVLGADLASGWGHDAVGYVALTFASLLLLSFDQGMGALLHPLNGGPEIPRLQHNPLVDLWNRLVGGIPDSDSPDDTVVRGGVADEPIAGSERSTAAHGARLRMFPAALSLLLGFASAGSIAYAWIRLPPQMNPSALAAIFTPPPEILDPVWEQGSIVGHEISRDGENPRLGRSADIWTVTDDHLRYQVVLSQPYLGWHELCICYENLDWELTDRSVFNFGGPGGEDAAGEDGSQYALARFRRDDGWHGYLLFSAMTYDGRVSPPPSGMGAAARLGRRFMHNPYAHQSEMMMLQLWLETPERLAHEDVGRLKDSFNRSQTHLLQAVRASGNAVGAKNLPR